MPARNPQPSQPAPLTPTPVRNLPPSYPATPTLPLPDSKRTSPQRASPLRADTVSKPSAAPSSLADADTGSKPTALQSGLADLTACWPQLHLSLASIVAPGRHRLETLCLLIRPRCCRRRLEARRLPIRLRRPHRSVRRSLSRGSPSHRPSSSILPAPLFPRPLLPCVSPTLRLSCPSMA